MEKLITLGFGPLKVQYVIFLCLVGNLSLSSKREKTFSGIPAYLTNQGRELRGGPVCSGNTESGTFPLAAKSGD